MYADLQALWGALGRSKFRRGFRLQDKEAAMLRAKGWTVLREEARQLVRERLGGVRPRNDGRQTPWRGHPVFVAQHGTGTCCRGCLETWHGIKRGKDLTRQQEDYVVEVIVGWLGRQGVEVREKGEQGLLF